MRLPQTELGFAKPIDEAKAMELVDFCITHGINYFDTAYIYHMGQSEVFLGKALKGYPRNIFYVADKFNVQAEPDYKKQFARQLDRLQMDRIDFYLLHGVTYKLISDYLDHGAPEYFREQSGKDPVFRLFLPRLPRCPAADAGPRPMGLCADSAELLRLVSRDSPGAV